LSVIDGVCNGGSSCIAGGALTLGAEAAATALGGMARQHNE